MIATVHNHLHIHKRQDHDLSYERWRFRPGDRIAFHFHGPGYGGNGKLYAKKGSPWPFAQQVIEAKGNGVGVAVSDSAFEGVVQYSISFDLNDGTSETIDPDMIIDRNGRRSASARLLSQFESAFELADLLIVHIGMAPPPGWVGPAPDDDQAG